MNDSPVTALLRDLIAIPSVNPAFAQTHPEWGGEGGMVDYLEKRSQNPGLEIHRQNVAPGRDNLWVGLIPAASSASKSPTNRAVMAPHLDTVGGQSLHEGLFDPRKVDGRIHGRGACDTKGCVAAMFHALERLAATPSRPQIQRYGFLDWWMKKKVRPVHAKLGLRIGERILSLSVNPRN